MAYAGKSAFVTLSGTGVTLTTAALVSADGLTFQMSASSQQGEPFAPTATITVFTSSAGTVGSSEYTLYRLNGSVVFSSSHAGSYNLTGTYLPTSTISNAHTFSYTISATNEDVTTFSATYRSRIQTVKDISGSIDVFWSSGNAEALLVASSSQPVALSFFDQSTSAFGVRAWAFVNQDDIAAAVDGVVDQSVGFEGTADVNQRTITTTTRGTSG